MEGKKLLVIILNKVEYLNDILSLLVEAGIANATIFDSEGISHYLAYQVPVFAGLRNVLKDAKEHNKTILALIDEGEYYDEFLRLMEKESIDFREKKMGIMFTVPLGTVISTQNERPF